MLNMVSDEKYEKVAYITTNVCYCPIKKKPINPTKSSGFNYVKGLFLIYTCFPDVSSLLWWDILRGQRSDWGMSYQF